MLPVAERVATRFQVISIALRGYLPGADPPVRGADRRAVSPIGCPISRRRARLVGANGPNGPKTGEGPPSNARDALGAGFEMVSHAHVPRSLVPLGAPGQTAAHRPARLVPSRAGEDITRSRMQPAGIDQDDSPFTGARKTQKVLRNSRSAHQPGAYLYCSFHIHFVCCIIIPSPKMKHFPTDECYHQRRKAPCVSFWQQSGHSDSALLACRAPRPSQ